MTGREKTIRIPKDQLNILKQAAVDPKAPIMKIGDEAYFVMRAREAMLADKPDIISVIRYLLMAKLKS